MKSRACTFAGAIIPLIAASTISVRAHICGPDRIEVEVGKSVLWRVYADRQETLSLYQPVLTGSPQIADVHPKSNFFAHHGDFLIAGNSPGTNVLQVQWSYEPTGAGGRCEVIIVVTPDDGVDDLETVDTSGFLVARDGAQPISSSDLFWQIDRYIPRESPKLIVFAQCFGGNMALYRLFQNMPNTTILSATTANQEAHYGGYHDDAARALRPQAGRTALTVHEEGSIGKSTLIPKDPGDLSPDPIDPTQDKETKETFHKYAELPRISGTLPPSQFSLEPVTPDGHVQSRHIVIFAGRPDSKTEFVLRHGTFTIPATIGTKERFADVADRDQIRNNFASEANTDVTSVGGKSGDDGWDHTGDLEGLHKAIFAAGEAIEASADPSKEQFILFVTDHGEPGAELSPHPRIIPKSAGGGLRAAAAPIRSTLGSNLQPFTPDHPLVDSMLRSPDNQPGIRLRIAPLGDPLNFGAGSLALEITNATGTTLLEQFVSEQLDLDGDGTIGSTAEEGVLVFFPVPEGDLIDRIIPEPFAIELINRSGSTFELRNAVLMGGAISMGNSQPQSVITRVHRREDGTLEIHVNGLKGKRHALESSVDFAAWQFGEERVFSDYSDTFLFQPAGSPTPVFLRVSRR